MSKRRKKPKSKPLPSKKRVAVKGEGFRILWEVLFLGGVLAAVVEFGVSGYVDLFMYCPFGDKCHLVEKAGLQKLEIAAGLAILLTVITAVILIVRIRESAQQGKRG
jgi:hypothetical protein